MKLLILVAAIALLVTGQPASAHVLISDETGSKGAILHIIPDDDPVAGQKATLFFDTQNDLLSDRSNVKLTIKNDSGEQVDVPTKTSGSLATADYLFPAQGHYTLTYAIAANGKTVTFVQSQRVSRGTIGSALDRPTYTWAELLTIGSSIGLALLAVAMINHRKEIAQHSKL